MRDLLSHIDGELTEIDEIVSDVDQLGRSVGAKAGDLHAAAFIGDGVHRVNKIFVTRNEHRGVVTARQRQHVNRDFNVEISFSRAVVERLQFFLNHAETVTTHPEQKTLLAFSADINARVEKRSQEATVAEQHPK